ncbi:MAG: hypothetical protein GXY07_10700 [Candidatus Hydrogenedentes bacterium]|nr:hypothetical protein [Candidatus Hydrogenedentota bacterium]
MQKNERTTCGLKEQFSIKVLLAATIMPVYLGSILYQWYLTLLKAPTFEAKGIIIFIFLHFPCALFFLHRIRRDINSLFLVSVVVAYSSLIAVFIQVLMGVVEL